MRSLVNIIGFALASYVVKMIISAIQRYKKWTNASADETSQTISSISKNDVHIGDISPSALNNRRFS